MLLRGSPRITQSMELLAMVQHTGNGSDGGHFTTYNRLNPDASELSTRWRKFDCLTPGTETREKYAPPALKDVVLLLWAV